MRVLVACEFSGVVRDAFKEKGHDAWSCDLLPTEKEGQHYAGDVADVIDHGWDLMVAHPPCTYIAVTGNKWFYHPEDSHLAVENRRPHPRFPDRKKHREEAVRFFLLFTVSKIPKVCIENPVGIMSTRWRKPNQIIQPFQFGHIEPKKTCLWLQGLPKLELTEVVEPDYMVSKSGKRLPRWYHSPSPSPTRQKMRSVTFQGIADAMAEQWG